MEEIKLEKISNYEIKFHYNKIYLGSARLCEDGFYLFDFKKDSSGWFSGWILKAIALELEELNEPMNIAVENYFKNKKNE